MPERIAGVTCTTCDTEVVACRLKRGRILIMPLGALVVGGAGAIVGSAAGIATGGLAIPATVPAGIAGAVIGSGLGYFAADRATDPYVCPRCDEEIDLTP